MSECFLMISADFVQTGGMDLGNYHLARFLAEQGGTVHLVSHRVDPGLLSNPRVFFHRAPRPFGSNLLGELWLRRLGRRVAAARAGAAVLVNGGNCPLPATNWVHYVHAVSQPYGGNSWWRRWKNQLAHRLFLRDEARAFASARLFIVNSARTREDLMRCYQISPERIHLVYYGTDPAALYPADKAARRTLRASLGLPPNKCLFIFVGALGDRRKGFDTLFAAWQAAGREFHAATELIVIGQGAELPQWQRRAAESPGTRSIRFLGFRRDVPNILRACDAFVAPTRYEAFGLAVQEALCCGLPAIVSRNAGVAECFSPDLGPLLLNDPLSVSELTDKLRLLHSQYRTFQEKTRLVGERLRTHTWNDMAREIQALLATTD